MNSKERLLAVLKGQIPDRVPVSTYELVGYNSHSFENQDPSYARLMQVIREKTDCLCMWNPEGNGKFWENAFPVELESMATREDNATIRKEIIHTPKGDLRRTLKSVDGVYTVWEPEHWCKNSEDIDKALSVPFQPQDYSIVDYSRIREELGDHGILMASLSDPLYLAAMMMDFGEYTLWAMMEEDHFARTIEILHERNMENLRRILKSCPIDLYRICGPEYACPPFLPPRFFEKYVLPYVKEMVDLIHQEGSLVRLHCHGKIGKVLEMIIATGADGTDPCEAPPDGDITLAEIKKKAAGRIAIFGNLQLKLLETGSPEDVRKAVKDCMEAGKPGGGYVIMPTAAPINTPLEKQTEENYLVYIETALELAKY